MPKTKQECSDCGKSFKRLANHKPFCSGRMTKQQQERLEEEKHRLGQTYEPYSEPPCNPVPTPPFEPTIESLTALGVKLAHELRATQEQLQAKLNQMGLRYKQ